MSLRAIAWAERQYMSTPVEQLALLTMGSLADDDGWAFIFDLAALAERLRVPPSEAEGVLRGLIAAGAIRLGARAGGWSVQLALRGNFDFRAKGEASA